MTQTLLRYKTASWRSREAQTRGGQLNLYPHHAGSSPGSWLSPEWCKKDYGTQCYRSTSGIIWNWWTGPARPFVMTNADSFEQTDLESWTSWDSRMRNGAFWRWSCRRRVC